MTNAEKLALIKAQLHISDDSLDTELNAYLTMAEHEILAWYYTNKGGVPGNVTSVPFKYEITQIQAVIAGFTHSGAEGEKIHNENGINRTFVYEGMVAYIRANVYPLAGV